ncbi:hypothetical protein CO058_00800 [candidate division WWE3 bacterium CG_4_9_14_0_2_um_filter_35_11]|uniref:IrrE N-terminal-like domain-containing protein n=1 Tax=candidate division WWE3 bacterium CG_4_9_14_0_2_um_filter_35_11 TaxID=1975077 RepID=A0A2M8EMN1_UNCKA|nr:MAG: hypothetical protein COV25_03890 [candidate division WWE3 bacterium CG10_big_fil_rev_8_21_14_0_10_35_32]PJC23937.1 MAG: hypothetical protein CO058_00800 [candidate division WWE3 bacterium CG_4_9_14_0_2_um_filter_35_11]
MSKDVALTKEDLIKLSEEYTNNGNSVDVVKLANNLGIKVFEYPFGEGVSGAVQKNENGEISIYISDQDSIERQRFSIAHELAHAVFHKDLVETKKIINRSKNDSSNVEIEANKLAEEILMPEKSLNRFIKEEGLNKNAEISSLIIQKIADAFKVSKMVAIIRLRNLNYNVPYISYA